MTGQNEGAPFIRKDLEGLRVYDEVQDKFFLSLGRTVHLPPKPIMRFFYESNASRETSYKLPDEKLHEIFFLSDFNYTSVMKDKVLEVESHYKTAQLLEFGMANNNECPNYGYALFHSTINRVPKIAHWILTCAIRFFYVNESTIDFPVEILLIIKNNLRVINNKQARWLFDKQEEMIKIHSKMAAIRNGFSMADWESKYPSLSKMRRMKEIHKLEEKEREYAESLLSHYKWYLHSLGLEWQLFGMIHYWKVLESAASLEEKMWIMSWGLNMTEEAFDSFCSRIMKMSFE